MARQASPRVDSSDLPIKNYDGLSVSGVSQRLDSLSNDDLREVRTYEKQNKDRDTLVNQIDQKMKSA